MSSSSGRNPFNLGEDPNQGADPGNVLHFL